MACHAPSQRTPREHANAVSWDKRICKIIYFKKNHHNHVFSLIFIEFHWFSLVFIDTRILYYVVYSHYSRDTLVTRAQHFSKNNPRGGRIGRKRSLRRPRAQQCPQEPSRTGATVAAAARTPKVKIHDLAGFAQSFGVFQGVTSDCQMFRHLCTSLEIQAHSHRVRPTAATTDLCGARECPPRPPGIHNACQNGQSRHNQSVNNPTIS